MRFRFGYEKRVKSLKKCKKKNPAEPFYGFCWVSIGGPNVNYPNTIVPIEVGFGFVIWLENYQI